MFVDTLLMGFLPTLHPQANIPNRKIATFIMFFVIDIILNYKNDQAIYDCHNSAKHRL